MGCHAWHHWHTFVFPSQGANSEKRYVRLSGMDLKLSTFQIANLSEESDHCHLSITPLQPTSACSTISLRSIMKAAKKAASNWHMATTNTLYFVQGPCRGGGNFLRLLRVSRRCGQHCKSIQGFQPSGNDGKWHGWTDRYIEN